MDKQNRHADGQTGHHGNQERIYPDIHQKFYQFLTLNI